MLINKIFIHSFNIKTDARTQTAVKPAVQPAASVNGLQGRLKTDTRLGLRVGECANWWKQWFAHWCSMYSALLLLDLFFSTFFHAWSIFSLLLLRMRSGEKAAITRNRSSETRCWLSVETRSSATVNVVQSWQLSSTLFINLQSNLCYRPTRPLKYVYWRIFNKDHRWNFCREKKNVT